MTHRQFVKYVLSFYGRGGIYAFRPVMRNSEARYALGILLKADATGDHGFDGDSFDRELARDIVTLMRDPTAHAQVGETEWPLAYKLFKKYAHKRWHSRRPKLRVMKGGR